MKKLLTLISVFAFVSAIFVACEKDSEGSASNTITITGSFDVVDKTYTNPTFDLGGSDNYVGFAIVTKNAFLSDIRIECLEDINLGSGYMLNYYLNLYQVSKGESIGSLGIEVSKEDGYVYLYNEQIPVNVTKMGEIGDYIEGNYEGTLYFGSKETLTVKGKFKVKHIEPPVIK